MPINQTATKLHFQFSIKFSGTNDLRFIPIGGQTDLKIVSTWPHSKFYGSFLPIDRKVYDKGFTAQWSVSSMVSKAKEMFNLINNNNIANANSSSDKVNVIEDNAVSPSEGQSSEFA